MIWIRCIYLGLINNTKSRYHSTKKKKNIRNNWNRGKPQFPNETAKKKKTQIWQQVVVIQRKTNVYIFMKDQDFLSEFSQEWRRVIIFSSERLNQGTQGNRVVGTLRDLLGHKCLNWNRDPHRTVIFKFQVFFFFIIFWIHSFFSLLILIILIFHQTGRKKVKAREVKRINVPGGTEMIKLRHRHLALYL